MSSFCQIPTRFHLISGRYWQEFLAELRKVTSQKFGADFIDDCLHMQAEEVKEKYGA